MITEEFDNPHGQFINHDTNDVSLYEAFKSRKHIDVRSFSVEGRTIERNMFSVNLPMSELNLLTIEDLESIDIATTNEVWTDPVILQTVNGKIGAVFDLPIGTSVTESVANPIDIRGFTDTDHFSIAFPGFSPTDLDDQNSTITIETNSVSLTRSLASKMVSHGSGNFEWRVNLSEFDDSVTHITKMIFTFIATAVKEVKINAIRILPADWQPMKLDIDTRTQRLTTSVTRQGTVPSDPFPHVWFSSEEPGSEADPRPFNSKLAVNFFTGDFVLTDDEATVKLFMRGRREDFLTQLDLDGTNDGTVNSAPSTGDNQWSLEQAQRQPNYGQARYSPRWQDDLNQRNQADLSYDPPTDMTVALTQAELERLPDLISESWLEVELNWKDDGGHIKIGTTETLTDDDRYVFQLELISNTQYVLLVDTEDSAIRVRVIPVLPSGQIDYANPRFDSQKIVNDFVFPRRKGRVGYLVESDIAGSWVDSVRSRGLMFGEFITNKYESITPVVGAQIFSGGSGDLANPLGLEPLGLATLTPDVHNSKSSDGSIKVVSTNTTGVQSTVFEVKDFANTEIHFDFYYPKTALSQGKYLEAGIIGLGGHITTLLLPEVIGDQWIHCRIPLIKAVDEQTGYYKLYLSSQTNTTWWIDNIQIVQRTVAWSARAMSDDAWDGFADNWTTFNQMVNSENYGGLFNLRGKGLQVRGQALTQSASIDKVYTRPKYAELGRLIWDVERRYR